MVKVTKKKVARTLGASDDSLEFNGFITGCESQFWTRLRQIIGNIHGAKFIPFVTEQELELRAETLKRHRKASRCKVIIQEYLASKENFKARVEGLTNHEKSQRWILYAWFAHLLYQGGIIEMDDYRFWWNPIILAKPGEALSTFAPMLTALS